MQFDEENEKRDFHRGRASGKERDREKEERASRKAFALRGFRGGQPTHAEDDNVLGEKYRLANKARVRAGTGGISRQFRKFQEQEGFRPSRKPSKTAGVDLPAMVSRFKRDGTLPSQSWDDLQRISYNGPDARALARMLRLLLVRSGIEENPGPSRGRGDVRGVGNCPNEKKEPGVSGQKRDVRRVKTSKGGPKILAAAESILIQQMENEQLKVEGEGDAAAEHLADAMRRECENEAMARNAEACSRADEIGEMWMQGPFRSFAFTHCDWRSNLPQFAHVAPSRAELPTTLCGVMLPHKRSSAYLLAIEPAWSYIVVEDGKGFRLGKKWKACCSCEMSDVPRPSGEALIARYAVETTLADGQDLGHCIVQLSVEAMAAARRARLASTDYCRTLGFTETWLSRHSFYAVEDSSSESSGFLMTHVFAAMLMLDAHMSVGPLELSCAAAQAMLADRTRDLSGSRLGPQAEGLYIQGYRTRASDVFPKQWAAAAGATRRGLLSARGAVAEFSQRALARGSVLTAAPRARASEIKTYCYARVLGSMGQASEDWLPHISGLAPAFPDPHDAHNQMVGFMKRVMGLASTPDDEARAREAAISLEMVDMLERRPNTQPLQDAVEASLAHGRTMAWAPADLEAYNAGVEALRASITAGSLAVQEFFQDIRPRIERFAAFIKQEAYDPQKLKGVRYIVAPCHYVRGVLDLLFRSANEHFFHEFAAHSVKGANDDETVDRLLNGFDLGGAGMQYVFGDWSSFESCVDGARRLSNEARGAVAAAPAWAAGAIRCFESLASGALEITGPMFSACLMSIRRSGEFDTSRGNFNENVPMLFGVLSRALAVPVSEVGTWFREWRYPWFVEGDDSLLAMPRELADRFRKYVDLTGQARLAVETASEWWDANFCGRTMVSLRSGAMVLLADPLDVLAKLQTWIGCDASTVKFDQDMLVAKAISYLIKYKGLPLVDPCCRALVVRYHERALRLFEESIHSPKSPGAVYLFKALFMVRGSPSSYVDPEGLLRRALETELISDEVRGAISDRCGISPEEQIRLETLLRYHFSEGTGPFVEPVLERAWRSAQGARQMLEERWAGLRDKTSSSVQSGVATVWAGIGPAGRGLLEAVRGAENPLRYLTHLGAATAAVLGGAGICGPFGFAFLCVVSMLPLAMFWGVVFTLLVWGVARAAKARIPWPGLIFLFCYFTYLSLYSRFVAEVFGCRLVRSVRAALREWGIGSIAAFSREWHADRDDLFCGVPVRIASVSDGAQAWNRFLAWFVAGGQSAAAATAR